MCCASGTSTTPTSRRRSATPLPPFEPRLLTARSTDGTHNDLADRMGRAGSRFGRNVPLDKTWPSSDPGQEDPSPRLVSRELLTATRSSLPPR